MTPRVDNEKETLRKIIRGERPLSDLRALSMDIEFGSDGHVLRVGHHISASADVHDLAKGFQTYRHDPEKLRDWAFFVEAADVELDVSSHPAGETLLNALWGASFGEPLSPDAVRAIEQLA